MACEVRGLCALRPFGVFLLGLFLSVGAPAADYPLRASADGPYLVDSHNVPFLVVGDAPHSLIVNLSDADAVAYLGNRASNGVNSVWVEALCVAYTGGRADGSMLDGTTPFTNTISGGYWDLTAPREAYWSHVDCIVQTAAANGIQVLLTPLDEGGLSDTALANGTNRCHRYGQFLGERYKNLPNILWQNGNDFQDWGTADCDAVITSIALGIKDTDTNHLHTVQLNYPVSDSLEDPNWWPIVSVNGVYTYYPTYDECLVAYNRTNCIPVLFLEGHYEYENVSGEMGTPNVLRRQEYWSLLSGSLAGHLYGNYYTWTFAGGWESYLNSPGITQLGYFRGLFSPREWYRLVPDQAHSLLTAGYGTYATGGNVSDSDYATAARTPDGTLAVVYTPVGNTLTIAMTNFAGSLTARWFDPSANTFTVISGSPFTNIGTHDFTTPGTNSAGDEDWVLLMETPPPPKITAWTFSNSSFLVSFATVLGQSYEVQSAANLVSGSWVSVATDIAGTGSIVQVADTNAVDQVRRFYRVKTGLKLIAPRITALTFSDQSCVLSFDTVLGQNYEVQSTADLASGSWVSVATNISGTGSIVQAADTDVVNQVRRFYRVKTGM
jgi:Protein of unknown function (DUF4038)/Putative collagen-binding domain of a collagenase